MNASTRDLLEDRVLRYNQPGFISEDPICIPHRFTLLQDIEIAGLFAAIFAWGQRPTIIRKCTELLKLMDDAPYEFIRSHEDSDLIPLQAFKHRTFNGTDTLYFIYWLRHFYKSHDSLEEIFQYKSIEQGLIDFHRSFFSLEMFPERTRKHISTPERNSACKRLNMYLRWMVRQDSCGVDFGLWRHVNQAELICPLDLHVSRVSHRLGLLRRQQSDWKAALELTSTLRKLDPKDPVKYDFALFGLGIMEDS